MAEDKDKKDNPYFTIGIAVAAGIVIGSLISGASSDDVRRLNRRVAMIENAAGEQLTAAGEQINATGDRLAALAARVEELGAVETAVDTGSEAIDDLKAQIEELAAQAPDLDAETQAAFDALSDRVNVLADQMGRIVASMLGSTPAEPMPEATDDAAAPAEAEPEAEAATEDATTEDEPAADAEDAIGEGDEVGLLLAVGDTGMIGNSRLFVSRIDTNRDAVRVMIVGEGPRMLGRGFGPLDLGNGCTAELRGIVDRMALIVGSCG